MPRHDRAPAFQFYPEDFAADGKVEAMSTEGVGAYILLLCKAWSESPPCTIPDDDRVLARWARLPEARWKEIRAEVLSAWTPTESGRFLQSRLYKERRKQAERRELHKAQGLKGAEVKWSGYPLAKDWLEPEHQDSMPTSSPTPSPTPSSTPTEGGKKADGVGPEAVAGAWNEIAAKNDLPRILAMHAGRTRLLRARLADPVFRERWRAALEHMTTSPFCRGENERGWKANFDWFLRPGTVVSILEGKYTDGKKRDWRSALGGGEGATT